MKVKNLTQKLLFTFGYLALLAVLWRFGVGCIFLTYLHVPCPGCGMSRALLSALHGQFLTAFSYHSMIWSIPILYWYFLFDGKLIGNKKFDKAVFIIIAVGFLINWVFRLVTTFI